VQKDPATSSRPFLFGHPYKKDPKAKIAPQILYIHKAAREDYSAAISIGSYKQKKEVDNIAEYSDIFLEKTNELLSQLFDCQRSFTQTEITDHCSFCDYKRICRR